MKRCNWRFRTATFVTMAMFALSIAGCATMDDIKRVEAMAQQAVTQSAEAKSFADDSAQEAKSSAASAAESAAEAKAAAEAAENAAARAEEMAGKSEAIFQKLMKK